MTFVLASNNAKKLAEMRAILSSLNVAVVTPRDIGVLSDPEENGKTFEENALIKARECCRIANMPAIADDSGLAVDELGGAPGIRSARYCEGTDNDRVDFLLQNMAEIPTEKRTAKFVSAVACAFPNGDEFVCRGECAGVILRTKEGSGGFGYDPIFFLPQFMQTFAQVPQEIKNTISHRANAIAKFIKILKEKI